VPELCSVWWVNCVCFKVYRAPAALADFHEVVTNLDHAGRFSFFKKSANRGSACKFFSIGSKFV
jgi:hypothetical protein